MLITQVHIFNNEEETERNQSRAILAAIATLIPLTIIATLYTGRPDLQDRQE
ncbi:MAG TPA: hypothetical protein VHF28_03400 [Nitrososphaera sp.]|nr:hypothetical protein [Nitrososphaera sp.]